MAHVGHGALIGRGTYRAWHIHGGKVSLTYESSLNYDQKGLIFERMENLELPKLTLDLINNRHKFNVLFVRGR